MLKFVPNRFKMRMIIGNYKEIPNFIINLVLPRKDFMSSLDSELKKKFGLCLELKKKFTGSKHFDHHSKINLAYQ